MENLMSKAEFCSHYNIEVTFLDSLRENGLIEIETINESEYIPTNQLHQLEKIIRFFYELNINLEGIDTINHLLERIDSLQKEIIILKNRLSLYEEI